MNRTMSSLLALGIGAATYAMRTRGMSNNYMDIGNLWSSKPMKRIRKRVAKAIY